MRIIEYPEDFEEWTVTKECGDCHSVVEFEEEDLHFNDEYHICNDYYVICPICENNLYIDDGKIPEYLKKKLRRKFS
jgi:hypothetical protein